MTTAQIFRTSPDSYVALCGVLSVPLAAWILVIPSSSRLDLTGLIFSMALPVTAAIWLAYFRLRIDDWGIDYRDLLGRNVRVAYSEVSSLKYQTKSYGGRSYGLWLLHLHDGRSLRLNLKPFPREAYRALCRRIHCDG